METPWGRCRKWRVEAGSSDPGKVFGEDKQVDRGIKESSMKLIHLSDLHLEKRVNEYSMLEDQEYILKKIINVIDDENWQKDTILMSLCPVTLPGTQAARNQEYYDLIHISD